MGMEHFAEKILTDYPHQYSITDATDQKWVKSYEWCTWCHDQFGPPGGKWVAFMSGRNEVKLKFKDENDLSWFLLKWG